MKNRQGLLFWVGLGLVVLLFGAMFGARPDTGDPLDPASTGPLGTHALVQFLEESGATVEGGAPDEDSDVALLLVDRLDPEPSDELGDWVEDGGTLIVADPSSSFAPSSPVEGVIRERLDAGACSLEGLDGLTLAADSLPLRSVAGAADQCFGDRDAAFLQVRLRGQGRVVSLGTGLVLTNDELDEADNAVLAAVLLLPQSQPTVAVLYDPVLTPQSRSILGEIPVAVLWMGAQLALAFVVLVWSRARRFGRPVDEPQPVELPGSLLARATGELLRRTGGHVQASMVLRERAERRIRSRLVVPGDLAAASLVAELVAVTGIDRGVAERVLTGPMANDRDSLARLVADLDAIDAALAETDPVTAGSADDPPTHPGAPPAADGSHRLATGARS